MEINKIDKETKNGLFKWLLSNELNGVNIEDVGFLLRGLISEHNKLVDCVKAELSKRSNESCKVSNTSNSDLVDNMENEVAICQHYKTCENQEKYKQHCSVSGIHKCYDPEYCQCKELNARNRICLKCGRVVPKSRYGIKQK